MDARSDKQKKNPVEQQRGEAYEFSLKAIEPHHIIAAALIVLAFLTFSPILGNDFINYDDNLYITDNPHVKTGLTLESIGWAFTTGHTGNWHPLTWLSLMLDSQIYGLQAWGFHLTNLLLHIANTILLFFIFRRMTGALWQSAFVAALFALHPLHVESVAWAAERKDILSTLFWILTMWAYVRFVEHPGLARYLQAILFFAFGLMAKPMLVTLPFVLILMDYWPLGRLHLKRSMEIRKQGEHQGPTAPRRGMGLSSIVREKIPFFALAAVSSVITFVAQRGGGAVSSFESLPLNLRVANALVSYVAYLGKTLWPTGLTVFYPHPFDSLPLWTVGVAGLLVLCLSALVVRILRRHPYVAVGWFWYVGTLVPVIGIVQVGAQAMADRYTYVPLIGIFIVVAWWIPALLQNLRARKLLLGVSASVILLALSVRAFSQSRYWQDSFTLFTHANQVTKDNWTARLHLGIAKYNKGEFQESIAYYREALRLRPYLFDVHIGLANALAKQGETEEAIKHYSEAARLRPDDAGVHNDFGVALGKQGKLDEAIAQYTDALRLDPEHVEAHTNLAIALGMQGRTQEAIAQFTEALRLKPDQIDAHYNLGVLYDKEGRKEEAVAQYSEVLKLQPDHADARKNLESALARQTQTTETPQQKPETPSSPSDSAQIEFNKGLTLYTNQNLNEAIPYFLNALRLKPDYWEASYNLGVIYHNQGKLKDAIEFYVRTVRAKPDYAEANYNLGVAYHGQGEIGKAILKYRDAIRLKPDYAQAYNNLGVAYYSQAKYKDAIEQYTNALRLRPDYAEARKNLEVAKSVSQGQNTIMPQPKK